MTLSTAGTGRCDDLWVENAMDFMFWDVLDDK